jgi:hypothetical protein
MSWRKGLLFPPMINFFRLNVGECGDYPILCEDCQFNIQYIGNAYGLLGSEADPNYSESNMHHSRQDGLQKGALEGCRVCGALWRKLSISQQNLLLSLDRSGRNNALTVIQIFPISFSNSGDPETALVGVGFNDSMFNDFMLEQHAISRLCAQCILHPADLEGN